MGKARVAADEAGSVGEDASRHKPGARHGVSKQEKKKWRELKLLKRLEKQRELGGGVPAVRAPLPFPVASKACRGVSHTLAVAVPGSILQNAQSRELRAYLAGQIARAAAVFCVDEVVVFNDGGAAPLRHGASATDCCQQLARILRYMECPQYLRKLLFPVHEDLRFAGLLNPLDCPHHLRATENSAFREGVVTEQAPAKGRFSLVNIGLQREVRADRLLAAGVRVTLRMDSRGHRGQVVPPRTPRLELGTYWGYSVRVADSLSEVFSQAPHMGGYDLLVGTSDRGQPVQQAQLAPFRHALVVFGGLQGLEAALESDDRLTLDDPADLFDVYVNSCPGQGSRTIRTEEAVLITLAVLQPRLAAAADQTQADTGSPGAVIPPPVDED